jgi:hypothetical protein
MHPQEEQLRNGSNYSFLLFMIWNLEWDYIETSQCWHAVSPNIILMAMVMTVPLVKLFKLESRTNEIHWQTDSISESDSGGSVFKSRPQGSAILTDGPRVFPQTLHTSVWIVNQILPQPLLPTYLKISYSLITLQFNMVRATDNVNRRLNMYI